MSTAFEDWISTVEACAILNRSEGWLRLRAKEEYLERKRVGSVMFYRRDQIADLARRVEQERREG